MSRLRPVLPATHASQQFHGQQCAKIFRCDSEGRCCSRRRIARTWITSGPNFSIIRQQQRSTEDFQQTLNLPIRDRMAAPLQLFLHTGSPLLQLP